MPCFMQEKFIHYISNVLRQKRVPSIFSKRRNFVMQGFYAGLSLIPYRLHCRRIKLLCVNSVFVFFFK